jgi:uncharacterized protein with PQ loop repeat
MFTPVIDLIGLASAARTTLRWLPQLLKTVRDKQTRALRVSGRRRAKKFVVP